MKIFTKCKIKLERNTLIRTKIIPKSFHFPYVYLHYIINVLVAVKIVLNFISSLSGCQPLFTLVCARSFDVTLTHFDFDETLMGFNLQLLIYSKRLRYGVSCFQFVYKSSSGFPLVCKLVGIRPDFSNRKLNNKENRPNSC